MYTHKWAVYYNNETQVASCKALSVVWSQGPDTWYVISNNCTLNVVVILQKKCGPKIHLIFLLSCPPTENFAHIKWVSKYLHLHTRIVQKCAELHGLAIMLAISGDLGTRLALPRVEEDDGSQLGQSTHNLPQSLSSKLSGQILQ